MKLLAGLLWFAAGSVVASIIGLTFVIPMSREAWETNVESDVYRAVEGALESIEQTADSGDNATAAAQLREFNRRFAEFRAGGPTPSEWWHEVVATTRPMPTTVPR